MMVLDSVRLTLPYSCSAASAIGKKLVAKADARQETETSHCIVFGESTTRSEKTVLFNFKSCCLKEVCEQHAL
jgi:hypothetical protein